MEKSNGEVVVANAALSTLAVAQEAFAGAAAGFGVSDTDDVQRLVDDFRSANHAS